MIPALLSAVFVAYLYHHLNQQPAEPTPDASDPADQLSSLRDRVEQLIASETSDHQSGGRQR